MAVPNTSTFTLQDVATEIYGSAGGGMSLDILFDDAFDSGFVASYAGSKDRLSNFRGYNHGGTYYVPSLTTFQASSYSINNGNNQCSTTGEGTFWHNGSNTGPVIGDTVYRADKTTLDANVYRKYIPFNFVELPATFGTNGSGVVTYRLECPV